MWNARVLAPIEIESDEKRAPRVGKVARVRMGSISGVASTAPESLGGCPTLARRSTTADVLSPGIIRVKGADSPRVIASILDRLIVIARIGHRDRRVGA